MLSILFTRGAIVQICMTLRRCEIFEMKETLQMFDIFHNSTSSYIFVRLFRVWKVLKMFVSFPYRSNDPNFASINTLIERKELKYRRKWARQRFGKIRKRIINGAQLCSCSIDTVHSCARAQSTQCPVSLVCNWIVLSRWCTVNFVLNFLVPTCSKNGVCNRSGAHSVVLNRYRAQSCCAQSVPSPHPPCSLDGFNKPCQAVIIEKRTGWLNFYTLLIALVILLGSNEILVIEYLKIKGIQRNV